MLKPPTSLPRAFFTADRNDLSRAAYVFLLILSLAFFMPGLTSLPATDRDESSFAQASKQMVETGNYIDIRIQKEPRYKKPIGIYWLQALSVHILNPGHLTDIWTYRVPSLVSAVISVLVTAALGSILFGPVAGFLAASMLAGCLVLNVEARQAKTDATLLATVLVAQWALARAYMTRIGSYGNLLMFWTAVGAGILIKGPIVILVVASTLLWLRLADRDLSWFSCLKPTIGIPYVLVLTLPWLIAINVASHGTFLRQSAGHDLSAKLFHGEFRGIMPPGLHFLVFPAIFFPSSLFGLLAIPDTWKQRRNQAVSFCLGWIVPAWIVFEISLTKLPHYVLPAYPAIAMLSAKALTDGFPALGERRWRWIPPLAIGIWLMVGTGLALLFALGPYMINHEWNCAQMAAGALLLIALGGGVFFLFRRRGDSVICLTAGSLLFTTCTFTTTLPGLQHVWLSRDIVALARSAQTCPDLKIVSATYNEPSFIFLAGTNTEF
nr:glycosyltransferase family 39 protein [Pseudomonadota bacterium]